ncbi:hypothetical protein [Bradyrhizobium elkanii]|uniref:hypothetical protein n=1 Tax=Bradyrhizobium elkanii TaxID=29448 RepID=UPI003D21A23B
MQQYKNFTISITEDDPGRFKAAIRMTDGALIKPVTGGPPGPAVVTQVYPSEQSAIEGAKSIIDADGIAIA